jgi:hypothetical protein
MPVGLEALWFTLHSDQRISKKGLSYQWQERKSSVRTSAYGGLGIWVQIVNFTFPLAQDIFHDMGLFLHAGQALIETLGFKDQLPVVDPEAL